MDRNFLKTITLFALLIFRTGYAQNKNSDKIMGCWKLRSIMSMDIDGDTAALPRFSKNSATCFLKKGTFSVQVSNDKSDTIQGKYSFSKDGNTLYQVLNANNDGMTEEYQVMQLDERNLELRFENNIYTFEKE